MEDPAGLTIAEVESELKDIVQPHQLGLHLRIPVAELDKIEKEHTEVDRQRTEVIKYWQRNSDDFTLGALATAVEKMGGYANLVKRLRKLETIRSQRANDGPEAANSEKGTHLEARMTANMLSAPVQLQFNLSDRLNECPKKEELKEHVWKKIVGKWEELAIELGLDDSEDDDADSWLDETRKNKKDDTIASYDLLKFWLKTKKVRPTWDVLINALRRVGLQDAVKSVNDHLTSQPTCFSQAVKRSQMLSNQQSEAMDYELSPSQVNVPSSQLSQSTVKSYKLRLKPRDYQEELAGPGIDGKNYVVCAPTNSGKTLVAAMIISDHLQKNSQQQRNPKVVVVVKTRPLADQQTMRLAEYIDNARVECRTGNRGGVRERSLQLHIKDALLCSDITVCTAGKLLDELNKGMVLLQDFSLMIIDECHNMESGNGAFAQIMYIYLELKGKEATGSQLPQVVGLTATPGVGKNPSLNPDIAVNNLVTLCAYMDATSGIKTVQEHVDELDKFVRKPENHLDLVNQSEQRQKFIQRIGKEMLECERFLNIKAQFSLWSQQYEQIVKEKKTELEKSENPDDRNKVSTVRLLECFSQTLINYMDLPYAQVMDTLENYDDLTPSDKLSDHEQYLHEKLEKLKDDLGSLDVCENPILEKLEQRLTNVFQQKPGSSGIVFVHTREQAEAISNWISDSKFAESVGINARILVGHTRQGSRGPVMSDEEQKQVMEAFHTGDCNLLVATSVAEEGLDIKQCNLVIRLHISSAKAKLQEQGRARAKDSQIVTIVSNDPKKLYKDILNGELLILMERLIHDQYNSLPSPQRLLEELACRQGTIMERVREHRELEKSRVNSHPARDVELKCKKCKIPACQGSDIYYIDKTNHHVVPGQEFSVKYTQVDHHAPGIIDGCSDPVVEKHYKIHCAQCNESWGAMGTWPSGREIPVLKCESFTFNANGRVKNFRRWKDRPFKVLPLSEWFAQATSPAAATDDQ